MTDTATETAEDLGPRTGVTPHLTIPSRGGTAAIEFYVQAFGAVELARRYAEDGERLMHCHLKINGASVMLNDEFPEWTGESDVRPRGMTLHVEVSAPDCWWARALAQGAEPIMEMQDQFWGARYGQIRDPFGHCWSIGGPAAGDKGDA